MIPTFELHRSDNAPPYITVACPCHYRDERNDKTTRAYFPWLHGHRYYPKPNGPEREYMPPEEMLKALDAYHAAREKEQREADEREAARLAEQNAIASDREAQRLAAMRIVGPWIQVRAVSGPDAGQVVSLRRQIALHRIACGTAVLAVDVESTARMISTEEIAISRLSHGAPEPQP